MDNGSLVSGTEDTGNRRINCWISEELQKGKEKNGGESGVKLVQVESRVITLSGNWFCNRRCSGQAKRTRRTATSW